MSQKSQREKHLLNSELHIRGSQSYQPDDSSNGSNSSDSTQKLEINSKDQVSNPHLSQKTRAVDSKRVTGETSQDAEDIIDKQNIMERIKSEETTYESVIKDSNSVNSVMGKSQVKLNNMYVKEPLPEVNYRDIGFSGSSNTQSKKPTIRLTNLSWGEIDQDEILSNEERHELISEDIAKGATSDNIRKSADLVREPLLTKTIYEKENNGEEGKTMAYNTDKAKESQDTIWSRESDQIVEEYSLPDLMLREDHNGQYKSVLTLGGLFTYDEEKRSLVTRDLSLMKEFLKVAIPEYKSAFPLTQTMLNLNCDLLIMNATYESIYRNMCLTMSSPHIGTLDSSIRALSLIERFLNLILVVYTKDKSIWESLKRSQPLILNVVKLLMHVIDIWPPNEPEENSHRSDLKKQPQITKSKLVKSEYFYLEKKIRSHLEPKLVEEYINFKGLHFITPNVISDYHIDMKTKLDKRTKKEETIFQ